MIKTDLFFETLLNFGLDTFYGVPDSLLKDICAYITTKSSPEKHIITANEGNAIGLAAGKYLATNKPAVVYLQNSGLGNTVNPILSLADEEVYRIPMLLMIGWRGEPNVHDEPQHIKQGKITLNLLDTMGIPYLILSDNFENDLKFAEDSMRKNSKPFALIIKKGTFSPFKLKTNNNFLLSREEAIQNLLKIIDKKSLIISTTGKASREIFEFREIEKDTHDRDFLTVGSMGHTSSIALGIALNTNKRVYCIDGDGSLLMHLGSAGILAQNYPDNLKYIIINNGSHESVGGQPTIAFAIDLKTTLLGLGFENIFEVTTIPEIKTSMPLFDLKKKSVLIIKTNQFSRENLGRPTSSPQENKLAFMTYIQSE